MKKKRVSQSVSHPVVVDRVWGTNDWWTSKGGSDEPLLIVVTTMPTMTTMTTMVFGNGRWNFKSWASFAFYIHQRQLQEKWQQRQEEQEKEAGEVQTNFTGTTITTTNDKWQWNVSTIIPKINGYAYNYSKWQVRLWNWYAHILVQSYHVWEVRHLMYFILFANWTMSLLNNNNENKNEKPDIDKADKNQIIRTKEWKW